MRRHIKASIGVMAIVAPLLFGEVVFAQTTTADQIENVIVFLNEGASLGKISSDTRETLASFLNIAKSSLSSDPSTASSSISSALVLIEASESEGGLIESLFADDLKHRLSEIKNAL